METLFTVRLTLSKAARQNLVKIGDVNNSFLTNYVRNQAVHYRGPRSVLILISNYFNTSF